MHVLEHQRFRVSRNRVEMVLWLMFVLSFVASQSPASTVSVASILDACPTEDKSTVLGRRAALFVLGNCVGLAISYALTDVQASVVCLICTALSFLYTWCLLSSIKSHPVHSRNLKPLPPRLLKQK